MLSQRSRVMIVIGLSVLPLLALSGYSIWQDGRKVRAQLAGDRLQLAQATALAVEAFIEGHLSTVRSVALHPALSRPRDNRELADFMASVAAANREWEATGVVGADGYSVYTSQGLSRPVFVGDRPYFKVAVEKGEPFVSAALIGRISGKPTVVLSVPFDLAEGGRGIVTAPLPTDRFGASLARRISSPSMRISVLDAEGKLFIDPDGTRVKALTSMRGHPAAEAGLAGRSGTLIVAEGEALQLVAHAPGRPQGWAVLVSEPVESAFGPARRQAYERIAELGLIVLVAGALAWLLGGRLAHYVDREIEARAEAEAARSALQRSLQTRDEFLAAASHDLRNPLATVRAAGDLLRHTLERTGTVPRERLLACTSHIDTAARRMSGLIDAFMDVARLQLGRPLELAWGEIDLGKLAAQAVEEAKAAAPRHRIELDAPPTLRIAGDGPRLQRVIGNLLENAIRYSPDGGDVNVSAGVWDKAGAFAFLSVRDVGIGIPPHDLERIFQRFERGSNVVGRISGTGIGLYGAKQIVEQHGGRIEVASAPGAGTAFTLLLPVERPAGTPLLERS